MTNIAPSCPFSIGERFNPEGQLVLEAMTEKLPNLRLAPGQDLRHIPQLIFRGYEKLEVTFDNGGATGLRSTERTDQS